MTQKELEDYLWGAANILRGMIDAADFKQYIFPLLFFKRISDLWDEEYKTALDESGGDLDYAFFAENHRFQIPEGCHWEDVRKKTVDVGAALQKALNDIEKANFEMLHDVFGDAQWTNKRRMSDEKMLDLIEHFSQMNLSVQNVPHDIMGDGYEYLIKKFADDSGHTAAEFYTNRTVVKLMTQITNPQPGESIYDPTCGSGGILLNSVLHVKAQGKEFRTLKLYGQELNLITSAIARINMFMHNVDEFLIVQGDTLDNPQILDNDELKKFDVIMANPPYSVKKWNREKWMNDPFGRNIWGTPPQGCADYAFQQHIMKSLNEETGRCVILFPHGVLFRDSENDIRKKMIGNDYVDAVIGLGKNLFYNSSMESCLLICRMKKPEARKGKIIFIDAKTEIRLERSTAYLTEEHIGHIADAYHNFIDIVGFSKVVPTSYVLENQNGNLSIQLYVDQATSDRRLEATELLKHIVKNQEDLDQKFSLIMREIEQLSTSITEIDFEVFRFDKLAKNITERIEPKETDLDTYVGLEHLDSDNLLIERTGKPNDVIGTKLKIYKGDIIFGKRRAYLRKVAVSHFDGIASAHSMILRAIEENIRKDFLPYFMQSEIFMERAVHISEGSLSPTIKWKTLSAQEFKIPVKDKQSKLAEILSSLDALIMYIKQQEIRLASLKKAILNEILG